MADTSLTDENNSILAEPEYQTDNISYIYPENSDPKPDSVTEEINPAENNEPQSEKPLERSISQSGENTVCTGSPSQKIKPFSGSQVGINEVIPSYLLNRTVWYVDASAAEGGDGSKEKPFREIQTALDACNASEKNTVLVNYASGALYSNFSVKIPDVIIRSESESESKYATITSPNYTGAVISADNVWLCKLKFDECVESDSLDDGAGAVFVHDCKNTEIKRCIITNCVGELGGGIAFVNAEGGIRGTRISEGFSEMGGAITLYNGSAWICNSTLYNNLGMAGGGVLLYESDSEIHRSEISGNTGLIGGGILTMDSVTGVYYSNISGNYALIGGGLCDLSGKTTVHDCEFGENSASVIGGGIYSEMSETAVHATYIIGNTADEGAGYVGFESTDKIRRSNISENSAYSAPGILISAGNSSVCGSYIINNTLLKSDGEESISHQQSTDKLRIPDEKFNADSLRAWLPDEYFETENAISKTYDFLKGQELSESYENISIKTGIGISVKGSDNIDIKNNYIEYNTPQNDNNSVILGGGVTIMNSSGLISGNTIENNYADFGAGTFSLNSTVTIKSNEITENNATTGGAGICLVTGNAEVSGNTVSYNNISGYGGGIFSLSGEHVIKNNDILNNTAGVGGAGICQMGGTSEILENTIRSNKAGNETGTISGGGGILVTGLDISSESIESSEIIPEITNFSEPDFFAAIISDATTKNTPGEIYINEDALPGISDLLNDTYPDVDPDSVRDQIFQTAVTADSNNADETAVTEIKSNTISQNSAESEGGGVKVYDSEAVISGNEIINNAAGRGGGVELTSLPQYIQMGPDKISDNTAIIGGGLSILNSICLIDDSEITDNEAASFGGGISTINGMVFIYSPSVSNNTAGTSGGGINSNASSLMIYGGTISDNSATGGENFSGGGGINSHSGYALINGCNILANKASVSGGGINSHSGYASIGGCNISDNEASVSGGGVSFISTNECIVASSVIAMNTAPAGDGLYIQDSGNLTGFGNLFMNDENILAVSTETSPFAWNAVLNETKRISYTIANSPYSGGNVWAKQDGTGISQTCTDANLDGICDSDKCLIYDNDGTLVGTDELPFYYNPDYGSFIVYTDPDGAEIEINRKSYGRTSDAGYYMAPGNYSAEMTLKDYFDAPLITVPLETEDLERIRYEFTDIPKFRSTGSGPAPLKFAANATGTSSDLEGWKWHVVSPDNTEITYSGESMQAVLNETGNYTVTLDAIWDGKTTTSVPKTVRVMTAPPEPKAAEKSSTKMNGTKTETLPDGSQKIFVNKTQAGNVTTTADGIIVEKPDGTKIQIKTDGSPSVSGGSVSGQVSSVTMEQPKLDAVLGGGLGNASVGVSMTMGEYDGDAGISTEISAGCADDAKNAFSIACPDMKEVAYTIYFTKSGFDNESAIQEATINFSVNTSWVDSMGGPGRITIVRWKDDGTSERINPTYLGISGTESLFRAVTDGFSVYGVAGFSVSQSQESSRDDDNSVGITDAENLAAGKTSTLTMSSSAFTEITLTPAKEIPDLRITAQVMNNPESNMGSPEESSAAVMEYVKTTLYYTTSASLENIVYTAEIPEKWLEENNNSLPAVWYYNESTVSWDMLEIVTITEENGNRILSVKAEMPGFGWFAVGALSDEFITEGEDLPLGPGPVIPSETPDETIKPESTQPAEPVRTETPEPTAAPLPGIVVLTGISLAAAFILSRRED